MTHDPRSKAQHSATPAGRIFLRVAVSLMLIGVPVWFAWFVWSNLGSYDFGATQRDAVFVSVLACVPGLAAVTIWTGSRILRNRLCLAILGLGLILALYPIWLLVAPPYGYVTPGYPLRATLVSVLCILGVAGISLTAILLLNRAPEGK